MQNWQLIHNSAQLDGVDGTENQGTVIKDVGFASTSHPKLKFNFTVDVKLRVTVGPDMKSVIGSDSMELLDIPAKTATRPNPTINYVDVNYYNYRTKVATRVEHGVVNLTFYDDADGKAHQLYDAYMREISPIANVGRDKTLIDNPTAIPFGKMSSLGALPNNPHGIIQTISVYHYYVQRGSVKRMEYRYFNPKVQLFELDELSMSESDVNTISMTFAHDGAVTEETTVIL